MIGERGRIICFVFAKWEGVVELYNEKYIIEYI